MPPIVTVESSSSSSSSSPSTSRQLSSSQQEAHFLPFGDLKRMIDAQRLRTPGSKEDSKAVFLPSAAMERGAWQGTFQLLRLCY
jgi:hypothetical protein